MSNPRRNPSSPSEITLRLRCTEEEALLFQEAALAAGFTCPGLPTKPATGAWLRSLALSSLSMS